MAEWRDEGFILSTRAHGEHAAIIHAFCHSQGLKTGLVQGGQGRKLAPYLQAGTQVELRARIRASDQMAQLNIEPIRSRAVILSDRKALAALGSMVALLQVFMPQDLPSPEFWHKSVAMLDLLAAGRDWAGAYPVWERDLLADIGFGLDLESCAVTGAREGLAFISPKTGRAVTRAAAGEWGPKLFPFVEGLQGKSVARPHVSQALDMLGHFLGRAVAETGHERLPEARARLVTLLG